MIFAHPYFLWLLLLIPLFVLWYTLIGRKTSPTLSIASLEPLKGKGGGLRPKLRHLLFALRMGAMALLVVALARPQDTNSWQEDTVEGIDIILAVDVSGSMQAMDLKPNRIEAARAVAERFILNRPNDNIGFVVFAAESYTLCPLTMDHRVLLSRLEEAEPGLLEDGTAIGLGLATSITRLKDSKAKSKVIILLTDGVNNAGDVTPRMAASLAKTFGVRIYTVGVGTRGEAPYPQPTANGMRTVMVPVDLDEATLEDVATATGGVYLRATDNKSLEDIYASIDELEKSKMKMQSYVERADRYFPFVVVALILLLLEFVLRNTLLRTKP